MNALGGLPALTPEAFSAKGGRLRPSALVNAALKDRYRAALAQLGVAVADLDAALDELIEPAGARAEAAASCPRPSSYASLIAGIESRLQQVRSGDVAWLAAQLRSAGGAAR